LAVEFGVSERTIRRDIEILSYTEPIYTQTGRHGGGVYVVEGYNMDRMYMSEEEIAVLRKIKNEADHQNNELLLPGEEKTLERMIHTYTKPKNQ
jgi:predicted DNA-binding transcriptional regulator YafY